MEANELRIQCIMDSCNVDVDVVMNYLEKEDHVKLFKELNGLCDIMVKLEQLTN